jgi:hypothetical protein
MTSEAQEEITEEVFLDVVSAIRFVKVDLSPIGAAILAAIHFAIADDSRSFSLKLGIEHALVLREVTALSEPPLNLIAIDRRSERTSRTHYSLTEDGKHLIARAFAPH